MFSNITTKATRVLNENRHVVNYINYVTSDEHKKRMKTMPKRLQIPRDKWFTHKYWHGRIHMPNYHVHFRQDMQEAVKAIVRSFQTASLASRRQNMEHALRTFRLNLRSLNGHVGIEERSVFPMMVAANPDVDLKFLWEDHKELHNTADKVVHLLQQHIRLMSAAKESKSDPNSTASSPSGKLSSLPVRYLKSMLDAAAVTHMHCVEADDLRALVDKHESAAMTEMKAALRLAAVSTKECLSKADVARLYMRRVRDCQGEGGARVLEAVLEFDTELLTHLGEEEETVVPMELQDRQF